MVRQIEWNIRLNGMHNARRGGIRYLVPVLVPIAVLSVPWRQLIRLIVSDDRYTHTLIAPIVSIVMMYLDRARIFNRAGRSIWAGTCVIASGILLRTFHGGMPGLDSGAYNLSVVTAGGITIVLGAFLACFGAGACQRAALALAFLLLTIPVPKPMMDAAIGVLQTGSAAISAILFRLIYLPVFRQGVTFALPGFDIEVAEQCSGIRSCVALCMATVVASHYLLRTWWRKMLLMLLTIPLAIFKNALRIVTIASLGLYISPEFLHGALHRYSGIPFSLVEVVILAPILIRWHRLEAHRRAKTRQLTSDSAQP